MILVLHNRYRHLGGEERAVDDLLWLARTHLGEQVELLERDSAQLGRGRAAVALLRGGIDEDDVAAAVRRTGARIVHAHNTNPSFGWRSLAAARAAGARVVLHLHNYRLVCAVGTCVNSRGQDCVRCQGANTAPGVALNCRGNPGEAVAYAAGLALHQRRLVAQADAVVVPSEAALRRLRALRAPVPSAQVVPHVLRRFATHSDAAEGEHALVASRLAPEKGVDVAIEACRRASIPLVVAGDGPLAESLRHAARGADVTFTGPLHPEVLADVRRRARVALVPSRAAETFGLAALEAMADGVPVAASSTGALADLAPEVALAPPGDAVALAAALQRVDGDAARGARSIEAARRLAAPEVVAPLLRAVYDGT